MRKNMMRTASLILFFLSWTQIIAQNPSMDWYSESKTDGIIIQNSFPKGGPYPGPTTRHHHYSYLVFFSRIANQTEKPMELTMQFDGEPIPIPGSPDTYMKLFLPSEPMTMDKRSSFSYGITELASLEDPTSIQRIIRPGEDALFYVVGLFYQTSPDAWEQSRGGNRAELVLRGEELFYSMSPQVERLLCGRLSSGIE